jgi:hypothetical protein
MLMTTVDALPNGLVDFDSIGGMVHGGFPYGISSTR